jgi:hypothetical protein
VQLRKTLIMAPRRIAARFRPPDMQAKILALSRMVLPGASLRDLQELAPAALFVTTKHLSNRFRRCPA